MTSEGRTKLKGDGDDGLMDYAPGKVLGTEELGSIRGAVTAKLSEVLGEPCDEVFPEYITVMISNGKTIREISSQLEDLLTAKMATVFSTWLGNHLKGLENTIKPSLSKGDTKDSSKLSAKGKGNETVSRGANERSKGSKTAVSKGEGVMASGDRGRVGSFESKSKVSGSKVSRRESREWSDSQSRDRFSSDSDRDRRSRSRDRSRDRFRRRSRDGSRDMPRDRGWERLRDRRRERSHSRERSRDHSKDPAWDRSRDSVRDGRNRPRAKSRDSRDRDGLRHYGSNTAPRDRYRNGGNNTIEGRNNGDRDRSRDGARDSFTRGGEKKEGRHSSGSHVGPGNKSDHDSGRRTRERSLERSTEERPLGSRDEPLDTDAEHSKEHSTRAREEERGKNGDRKKEKKSKGGTKDKAREKKKARAAEKEEMRGVAGGDQEPAVVSPPAKIEDPKAVSVVASVAVVGDGVKKEELDAANERAKLPDLRTVIERSRRRPNPAQQDDDDGDEREEAGVDKRWGLVKGRMASVQGGMRGFSPEKSPSSGREAGVKRDFAGETTSSRQRAFAASGGGRLLSTAVMQSVQSAMSTTERSVTGANGEKRRKSETDREIGNSDTSRSRYSDVIMSGSGRTVEPDQAAEEITGAPLEEDMGLHTPAGLRASAPEFQPSHGISHAIPANMSISTSAPAPSSGATMPVNPQNDGNDDSSLMWPSTTVESSQKQDYSVQDSRAGRSGGRQPSSIWERLGPRVNNGNGPTTSLLPAEPIFVNSRLPEEHTQNWAEWAQSIGSLPDSPSDAAAKWAAALRVAAGAATAAAASSNSTGISRTSLARRGSEDLAFMASYDGAAQAEESSQFELASWEGGISGDVVTGGTSGSLGGGRGVSFSWRGGRGVPGGRVGRGGGRNFTWVREGLRGRGRGTGAAARGVGRGAVMGAGGRGFRGVGTGVGRGRPIVAKSLLGKGGGWHSTKSVVARSAAGTTSQAAVAPGRGGGWERETWNKVWVRKELRMAEKNGGVDAGTAQEANENS